MSAVRPSREIRPVSGGTESGSTTPVERGALPSFVTSASRPLGSSAIGVAWWYTTIGFSAPSDAKFLRSSSRTTCAIDPCASQPAPDSALDSVSASGAAANATTSQVMITARRWRAIDAARREKSARSSGGAEGSWSGDDGSSGDETFIRWLLGER